MKGYGNTKTPKIGDYVILRVEKGGGLTSVTNGFVYEVSEDKKSFKLKDIYGNKSKQTFNVSDFGKARIISGKTEELVKKLLNKEAEKTPETKEEKPKQRSLSYKQQVVLMIGRVKALGAKMSEAQVISEGLKLMALRPDAAANDKNRTSKRRLSPTPENLIRWATNPGEFDLIGVDTIDRSANPTSDYKRQISRQKLFNLYNIKVN